MLQEKGADVHRNKETADSEKTAGDEGRSSK